MLKDKILGNIFKKNSNMNKEKLNLKLHGRVQTWALINDEVIYYDDGSNTVTDWAKHANIHLMTGESFSTHGNEYDNGTENIKSIRSIDPLDHTTEFNSDGTILSKKQFLSDNLDYYDENENWFYYKTKPDFDLNDSDNSDNYNNNLFFPTFPTKMVFGTGLEFENWDDIDDKYKKDEGDPLWDISLKNPANGGWSETSFNENIENIKNYYSNRSDVNGNLKSARTVNSPISSVNISPVESNETGITGIVKSLYDGNNSDILESVENLYLEKKEYRGLGKPSFIYFDRKLRNFEGSSEVQALTGDLETLNNIESAITYSITMPAQTVGEFYPYNGYLLKEVGLFADALITIGNEIPQAGESSIISKKMPCGIMWAKRKINPVFKRHEVEIVSRWTLYYA